MKSIWNNAKEILKSLGLSVRFDRDAVIAVLIRVSLIVLFSVLQTTLFSRFRLFNSTPDLVLATVIAIAINDKMVRGAAYGVLAGFIVDSIGSVGFAFQPLFLGAIGLFAGYFIEVRFSDNFAVRAVYIVIAACLRSVLTLLMCALTMNGFVMSDVFVGIVLPEIFTTVLFSAIPFVFAWLCLERLGTGGKKNQTSDD